MPSKSDIAMSQFLRFLAVALGIFWPAIATGQNVYFGNLHSHTSYSDGSGTPEDAYRYARFTAHLDFLAITEHNHRWAESGASADRRDGILIATNPSLYTGPATEALIPTAERWTEDGSFVALYGQEFSSISQGNHVNVFDAPRVIDVKNGEFSDLISWVESNPDTSGKPPLIQFNHPALFDNDTIEYGLDDFPSQSAWIAAMDPHVQLIEVLNGPAMARDSGLRSAAVQERDYFHFLNLGFHLAPSTGQDNHYATWGTVTDARVAIIADQLTKASVLEALRNRHAYATEDRNLRIIYTVNGHLSGDIVSSAPAANSELDIRISIADDDEPAASYRVEAYSDVPGGEPVQNPVNVYEIEGDTNGAVSLDGVRYTGPGQYVLLKVIQIPEDGAPDRAWTAPVWFEPQGFGGGGTCDQDSPSSTRSRWR